MSYFILLFRNFQRLVPITNICSADLKSINRTVLENFLPGEDTKGSVSVSKLNFILACTARSTYSRNTCNSFLKRIYMEPLKALKAITKDH